MESNGKAEKHGLEGDVDLRFLLVGGELLKVRSSSWKKNRFYKLQEDCTTMWHESHRTFKRNQTFSIDDVDSVRKGRQSEGLQKHTEAHVEDLCFSIIFKGRRRNLDLVATSAEEARQWVNGLEKILSNVKKLNRQQTSEHWIFNCMRKADKNKDNKMTLKELKHFLRQINIEVDDMYAEVLFAKCDKSNSGSLEGPEIKHFYDLLVYREEIDVIYGKYATTGEQMSVKDLLNFLMNEQREVATMEDAVRLIERYELDDSGERCSSTDSIRAG
eukprot:XP_014037331.1 PREDICTED: 1-phosphatidylinositol 4,5-bisphosphate phosphodiesterase delta-1 [Salmo salar]